MERVPLRDLVETLPGASEHAGMRGHRMNGRTRVCPYKLFYISNF